MRQKQKIANAINRKKVVGEQSDKPSRESVSGPPRQREVVHVVNAPTSSSSMHNPELGGAFGLILNKDREVEIRKGGALFSITYTNNEKFKTQHEIFTKLNNEFQESIAKKLEEPPVPEDEAKNIKQDGIYIDKNEKLIGVKKVYEFPDPPRPPTPKSFFPRKSGLGISESLKHSSLFSTSEEYKSSYFGSGSITYGSYQTSGGIGCGNKQPPDMDPEMVKLLKENQMKLNNDSFNIRDHDDPGIYTVPMYPNQPIHPESEISKKIHENRQLEEAKVCIENIERIEDELLDCEHGIPNAYTLAEIGEMDIMSLNQLFKIPDFLVIRNYPREQRELAQFNSLIPESMMNSTQINQTTAEKAESEKLNNYENGDNIKQEIHEDEENPNVAKNEDNINDENAQPDENQQDDGNSKLENTFSHETYQSIL